jgi:hypothetical protein
MKHGFRIALLLIVSLTCTAQAEFDTKQNLSGLWSDVNTADFKNTYMILAQDGDDIFVTHYLEWKEQPLVEYGRGTRDGNLITYTVTVTRPIDGWATSGTHRLVLSEDGNRLVGEYETDTGLTGPLVFERKGQ